MNDCFQIVAPIHPSWNPGSAAGGTRQAGHPRGLRGGNRRYESQRRPGNFERFAKATCVRSEKISVVQGFKRRLATFWHAAKLQKTRCGAFFRRRKKHVFFTSRNGALSRFLQLTTVRKAESRFKSNGTISVIAYTAFLNFFIIQKNNIRIF